jgi:hypothetical protein
MAYPGLIASELEGLAARRRVRRRALPTTRRELADMPSAASHGDT